MELSTTRAFQNILSTYQFPEPTSWPEGFAIKRFLKKMEVPDHSKASARKHKCFSDWVAFDESLRLPRLLPGNWYKARLLIHEWCKQFRLDPVVVTNGSEATPTFGRNSIESKLMRSKWECTVECFDLWATTAYETLALKRAVRARFSATLKHDSAAVRAFHKESWKLFSGKRDQKFLCFKRTLSRVTFIRDASRFSTTRKTNEKDRPIDLQPLCNMLVQRCIGNGFRALLKRLGVDLNTLAGIHRLRIRDRGVATIDLQNASDSIHIDLIKFLFPKHVFSLIMASRTSMTEGLDGHYYVTNKVSAMGNGFTFELMTTILRALGLQHDSSFSVFGDDIIIRNSNANALIGDLVAVGFLVNDQKSFIDSPFRESCGGNFHDDFGYIESYDFEYPQTIHDCVVLNNKAFALGCKYPSFKQLSTLLLRAVPKAWHGPSFVVANDENGRQGYNQSINLSTTFWSNRPGGEVCANPTALRVLGALHYNPESFKMIYGFVYIPAEASRRRLDLTMKRHTGKYFMYLYACRVSGDVVTDCGSWQRVAYLTDGEALFRLKSLLGSELRVVEYHP